MSDRRDEPIEFTCAHPGCALCSAQACVCEPDSQQAKTSACLIKTLLGLPTVWKRWRWHDDGNGYGSGGGCGNNDVGGGDGQRQVLWLGGGGSFEGVKVTVDDDWVWAGDGNCGGAARRW